MADRISNKIRKSFGEQVFDVTNILFMILMCLLTLYPFWHVFVSSFSDPIALMKTRGLVFFPVGTPTLRSYAAVFSNENMLIGYRNTLLYVVLGTSVNMVATSLAAYVLSRRGYMLKRFFSLFVVFTMFFSGGLVPFYLQVNAYKLQNTIWSVILPYAIATYNMIILRTAFASVPPSLEESARIDGANDLLILVRIMLPLTVPTLAVIALYYIVYHWNSWFPAMIFIRQRSLYPLQIFLREILILSDTREMTTADDDRVALSFTLRYATIIVATVPILLVYPYLQKYFVKGVMLGAVKG